MVKAILVAAFAKNFFVYITQQKAGGYIRVVGLFLDLGPSGHDESLVYFLCSNFIIELDLSI